jgi:hypothetical protein
MNIEAALERRAKGDSFKVLEVLVDGKGVAGPT